MIRIITNSIILFSFVFTAWGASSSYLGVPQETRISTQRQATSLTPSFIDTPIDSNYLIGPGDFFDLYIEGIYLTAQVSPEGSIGIERVGVIDLSGLRLAEAKRAIVTAVSKVFERKECFVQLSQLKRFRISLYGAVAIIGQLSVDGSSRLSGILRTAGGTLPLADLKNIEIVRGQDTIHYNMEDAERSGSNLGDPILLQGDKVFVPFIEANNGVITIKKGDDNQTLAFRKEQTIADYLIRAGLFNKNSIPEHLIITDNNGKVIKEGAFDSLASFRPKESFTIELPQPKAKQFVYVAGMVGHIGSVEYNALNTPIDYVAAAGITPYSAPLGQIEVVRYTTGERENIDEVKGVVYPGDVLELPRSRYERAKDFTMFFATLLGVLSSTLIIYTSLKK